MLAVSAIAILAALESVHGSPHLKGKVIIFGRSSEGKQCVNSIAPAFNQANSVCKLSSQQLLTYTVQQLYSQVPHYVAQACQPYCVSGATPPAVTPVVVSANCQAAFQAGKQKSTRCLR